ncbi:hypothetical protein [Malaciobacter mytili]|uniref:hypothetical protein n=1 Tax=Malaciobacter mytili TaxID=603050 RepID=UPI003A8362B7
MKKFILLFISFFYLHANSYEYNKINMEANFNILDKNNSKNMKFYYKLGIYYDTLNGFKEKSYCFFNTKVNYDTSNKPKYKICLKNDNKAQIYILNKSNRYSSSDEFNIQIKDISLKITNKKRNKSCNSKATSYSNLNKKITKCLKDVNELI